MSSPKTLGTALSAAVDRMAENRVTAQPGTALAVPGQPRPMLELRVDDETGEVLLPAVPRLPAPAGELRDAMRAAAAAGASPPPVKDEDGRVVWVPPKDQPLTAPAAIRRQAADHAQVIGAILAPGAEDEVIRDWLQRWAQHCRRQQGADYEDRETAILRAVRPLPGIAFNEDTAALAAQSFEWLPTPKEVFDLLSGWLRPYQQALDAARRVANAADPEPKAREAPAGTALTPEQAAERRAAIAGSMRRFHEMMAEVRERNAGPAERQQPVRASYIDPLTLALRIQAEIEACSRPEAAVALQARLNLLRRQHPEVADYLDRPHGDAPEQV